MKKPILSSDFVDISLLTVLGLGLAFSLQGIEITRSPFYLVALAVYAIAALGVWKRKKFGPVVAMVISGLGIIFASPVFSADGFFTFDVVGSLLLYSLTIILSAFDYKNLKKENKI